MAAVIVLMIAATFIEKIQGTPAALKLVYHNPVFMALWGLAAVCALWFILQGEGLGRRCATVLLHISFPIILAGALITHIWGKEGRVLLEPGKTVTQWVMEDGSQWDLPVPMTLQEFQIDRYPGSTAPSDYRSIITVGTGADASTLTISMNNIGKIDGYRFYQADYDGDSSILMVVRDPWGVAITYLGYLLLLAGMLGFFFQKESGLKRAVTRLSESGKGWRRYCYLYPAVLILALLALFIIFRTGAYSKEAQMAPVLRSPLLFIHVTPIVLSYILFAALAVIGIIGLISKKASGRLMDLSLTILYPAVFLITFGTFLGAVWANISWGSYWAWDPKETWALITLLVYARPLHGSSVKAFRNPRFFHAYTIIAFLCVLITYFGVNLILGGMHSYS
ncbi:MAG: cytochrome c biogenesis protein CcsA [Bacteroidales bacterium]|nr:cytochrome c biogenesis protein CcsA [Bacteroidales bacterium]